MGDDLRQEPGSRTGRNRERRGRTRSRSPSHGLSNHRSRSPLPRNTPQELKCGNSKCGGDHELRDCPGPPSPAGDIIGCPICNTESHAFDSCKEAREMTIGDLWQYLCFDRFYKPPIRSIINVLMIAAHQQNHWNLPVTKSFAKENWGTNRRDPSFPGNLVEFASAVNQNWSDLTRDLCHTECEVTDSYAVMFMGEDRSGISAFDFVPLNLLKQGKPLSTTRGRVWSDRHHEPYARWVNYRPEQSRRDIDGCDKEDHIKEHHTKDSEHLKSQRERHGHQMRLLQILLDHESRTQSSQGTAIQSSAIQKSQDSGDQHTRMLKVLDKMLDHELKE